MLYRLPRQSQPDSSPADAPVPAGSAHLISAAMHAQPGSPC